MRKELSGSRHDRSKAKAVPVDAALEAEPRKTSYLREKAPEMLGYYGMPLLGITASAITENPSPAVITTILLGKDAFGLTKELINHRREIRASQKKNSEEEQEGIQLVKRRDIQG